MLPFLGTQELGKDGGSSRETRSAPGPPLPCPLTPAARRERSFCLTSPFCTPFPAPSSPRSAPPCRAASAPRWRGAAHPGRPLTPRERNHPALPSLAELPPCAQPLPAGIRAVPSVWSCHPPGFVPPVAPRASRAGWIQPHHPCGAGQPSAGPMVHGGLQTMHRVCRAAGAAIPAPASSGGFPSQPARMLTHRAGSGALAILPVSSRLLFPIRRVWRALGAVAGRLWVTEESRKTGAGFSSPAPCPRGAGGARRWAPGGRLGHSPGPGRGDGGCSSAPGGGAGRDGQGGWRGTEQWSRARMQN